MARLPAVDPTVPQTPFKRSLTRFVLSKPGTWLYVHVSSRVDPWLIRSTGGRVDSSFGAAPVVLLTVRGARSGIERTVPLWYFTDGEDVIVIASSFGRPRYPAWYHNLKANPEATLYRRGARGRYTAQEVEGPERERLYALATQLYSGYSVYQDRVTGIRHVPVMRLTPID